MKCNCCKAEFLNGQAKCPICAFPTLMVDDVDIDELIRNYKNNKLKDVAIYIKIYNYSIDNGNLSMDGEEYIKVVEAWKLEHGNVYWMDEAYEDIESANTFTLTVSIGNSMAHRECDVNITPSRNISHSMIGVLLEDGFTIRFIVGTKENYVYSEAISLI